MIRMLCTILLTLSPILIQAKPRKFSETITWEINGKTLLISGKGQLCVKNNDYPWSKYASKIESVVIGDGITRIGAKCFCSTYETPYNIKNLSLPPSLHVIEEKAFSHNFINDLEIPEGVTTIYSEVFLDCSIRTLTLPSTLIYIGDCAFEDNYIFDLSIPSGTRIIRNKAFSHCQILHLSLPKTLKVIGSNAFSNNPIRKLNIPEGVTIISSKAFSNCKIKDLTLPTTLEKIEQEAFIGNKIENIYIPDQVIEIGKNAFTGALSIANLPPFINNSTECIKIGFTYNQWHEYANKPKFDPAHPPLLHIDNNSINFVEMSGNKAIDANEECAIEFTIKNIGTGIAYNNIVKTTLSGSTTSISTGEIKIAKISPGESRKITIPIVSGMSTINGKVNIDVSVIEPNGFGPDPFVLNVNTKAFVAPQLRITDYALVGQSGTLQKRTPFSLQVLLQNLNYGYAEDVNISISVPQNVYLVEGEKDIKIESIAGGEVHSLEYVMIANNNYLASTIPITIQISEKYRKYAESRTIDLAFDQVFASNKISVDEISTGPRKNIEIASLSSEVDKNIPITGLKNNNTFAIIIANENYQNDAKVDYALNDGRIFKEYCLKTLGIPESNIKLSPDATLNNLRNNISWIKDVASVYKGEAEIIFYYAGHGVPDDSSKEAFLLPVDGDGRLASQTGYSLKQLYSDLASCNTKSTLVFMDACFSGAQRNGQMLASARGVVIKAKDDAPQGNMVVFSAASAEQTAHQFTDKQHGMFTYFLLKKLQETNGNVTLGELGNYIIDKVSKESIVRNSKLQTPTVTPSSVIGDWTNMKL